jgi:F0F1-type ATP synthase epsilon subunit
MVARYKTKRLVRMMAKTEFRALEVEGSERLRAKQEVKQGLKDNDDSNDLQIRLEAAWDREMEQAEECWRRQQANPDEYVCECFNYHINGDKDEG